MNSNEFFITKFYNINKNLQQTLNIQSFDYIEYCPDMIDSESIGVQRIYKILEWIAYRFSVLKFEPN